MSKLFLSCMIVFLTRFAWAQVDIQVDLSVYETEMLSKFDVIRDEINMTRGQTQRCEIQPEKFCTFDKACQELTKNATKLSFGKNSKGEEFPNFMLREYYNMFSRCAQVVPNLNFSGDKFYNLNFLSPKEQIKAQSKNLNEKAKTAEKFLKDAQRQILETLRAKFPKMDAATYSNLKSRIESVKLVMPSSESLSDLLSMGCEAPNALYYPTMHTITICPQMLELPDSALKFVMAHELAHSIDPCSAGLDLYKNESNQNIGIDPDILFDRGEPRGKKMISGIPLNKSPYGELISCLQNPASIKAAPSGEFTFLREQREELEMLETEDDVSSELIEAKKKQIDRISERTKENPYCKILSGSSHIQEGFADWMAAELVAKDVSNAQGALAKQEIVKSASSLFVSLGCPSIKDEIHSFFKNRLVGSQAESCVETMEPKQASGESEIAGDPSDHPDYHLRINRILMAHPQIQKVMGCDGQNKAKYCP